MKIGLVQSIGICGMAPADVCQTVLTADVCQTVLTGWRLCKVGDVSSSSTSKGGSIMPMLSKLYNSDGVLLLEEWRKVVSIPLVLYKSSGV